MFAIAGMGATGAAQDHRAQVIGGEQALHHLLFEVNALGGRHAFHEGCVTLERSGAGHGRNLLLVRPQDAQGRRRLP
jgi:hypothetical protein